LLGLHVIKKTFGSFCPLLVGEFYRFDAPRILIDVQRKERSGQRVTENLARKSASVIAPAFG
jgi:hypothetical protein